MAGKKKSLQQLEAQQMQQSDINMQQMAEIAAIEEQTKVLQQESQNKEHDEELNNQEIKETLNVIGDKEISEALRIFKQYKDNKAELEQRLIDNERIWKMEHWAVMSDGAEKGADADKRIKPKSAWLVNTILNKHADAMDNFPEAIILPRSKDDEDIAKKLSQIIPVILDQNDFEKTYSDVQWYKSKNGIGVYGIFWNNDKENGLGNIEIKKIDITNLYWKSGITDIQDSPNVFVVTMMDNDELQARFPQLRDKTGTFDAPSENDQYNYGESVDTSNATAVYDWYYKRRIRGVNDKGIPQVKTVLHYCKFAAGQVLYASENDPNFAERGWYDHGEYPFVADILFPIERNICGMGYIDLVADNQMYIDQLRQAILENAKVNARPKYIVRGDGDVNEDELLDSSKPIVHAQGDISESGWRQVQVSPLAPIYETVYMQLVEEMKETSGNTATSQGQTSSVTTASGIASLMEASGKLSRDATSTSYRAFKKLIHLVIELMRQFYTETRCFRIIGEDGNYDYVNFDNSRLREQSQGAVMGPMGETIDLGSRLPIMDIDVKIQKKSAYAKETQNQTALNLYSMGFFAPANADASLACLTMMDFDNIDKMKEIVRSNGTLFEMVQQLQQELLQFASVIDAQNNSNLVEQITGNVAATNAVNSGDTQSGSIDTSRGSLSSQAASATRESTAPRS